MPRTNLKVFRIRNHLTQDEMARKIGCGRQVYIAVESGRREGRQPFWEGLRTAFNLDAETTWDLMTNDKH